MFVHIEIVNAELKTGDKEITSEWKKSEKCMMMMKAGMKKIAVYKHVRYKHFIIETQSFDTAIKSIHKMLMHHNKLFSFMCTSFSHSHFDFPVYFFIEFTFDSLFICLFVWPVVKAAFQNVHVQPFIFSLSLNLFSIAFSFILTQFFH